jgi:predicted unusual protein kinase regulating ubiquinone biosynthesis (AarF/ABC1/UbiB family)
MASLKTGPIERNIALARLGLGAGTQIIAHSIINIFRGEVARDDADRDFYRRQAEVLANELGKLKGSVMKAGQMLSLYGQYFLPKEAVKVLSTLQVDTPPVAWKVVAPVLERSLGRRRLAELEINETPMAAASLGQAHRARRKSDGLDVVVKIQYPGVANAIESDIATLSRLLLMSRLIPKGLDLTPMFAEVRDMLFREVDYVAEREFTEDFARRLAGDTRFVVPTVIGDYCSDKVLTTTFESGTHVEDDAVQSLSLQRRNRLGHAFIELFLVEFFKWGLVQTDPHFGNYRIRIGSKPSEDRIVLLDFGATRHFAREFMSGYAEIVRGALLNDQDRVREGSIAIGLMPDNAPNNVIASFMQVCRLIVEPFERTRNLPPDAVNSRGAYRWGDTDLPMRVANTAARSALSTYFRVPPREIVFLHRRLAGVFIMMATLRAELNARPLMVEYLDLPKSA